MPSFKASDELTSKPAWLTAAQQTNCHGADAAETGSSGLVMHQGWTVPAGGNGNPFAQRETIACANMISDIGAGDDGIWSGIGGGGSTAPAMTKMIWSDAPTGYSTDTWGSGENRDASGMTGTLGQNPYDSTYGELNGSHSLWSHTNYPRTGSGFLAQQQYSGGDWYEADPMENFNKNIWSTFEAGISSTQGENYRYTENYNPMPYTLRLYPKTLPYGQSITYPAGITLDLPLQMEKFFVGQYTNNTTYQSGWYFTLVQADMDFTQPAWLLHTFDAEAGEIARWVTILGEWASSGMFTASWDWAIDESSVPTTGWSSGP